MRRFKRRDWHKYKRLGQRHKQKVTWRKPKGIHSKTRQKQKGYQRLPSIGIKKSGAVKELALINNIAELKLIKRGAEVMISKQVGTKKRALIEKGAGELGIIILNKKMESKK